MRASPLPTGYSLGRKQLTGLCGIEPAAHAVYGRLSLKPMFTVCLLCAGTELVALHGAELAIHVV